MIDLSNTILYIIYLNKRNEKALMENFNKVVLATRTPQILRKTYTTKEFIN